jgi:hypothetical protein
MPKEKPSPTVIISTRDLKDIIKDELYGLKAELHEKNISSEDIKEVAKAITKRALLSPKPSG